MGLNISKKDVQSLLDAMLNRKVGMNVPPISVNGQVQDEGSDYYPNGQRRQAMDERLPSGESMNDMTQRIMRQGMLELPAHILPGISDLRTVRNTEKRGIALSPLEKTQGLREAGTENARRSNAGLEVPALPSVDDTPLIDSGRTATRGGTGLIVPPLGNDTSDVIPEPPPVRTPFDTASQERTSLRNQIIDLQNKPGKYFDKKKDHPLLNMLKMAINGGADVAKSGGSTSEILAGLAAGGAVGAISPHADERYNRDNYLIPRLRAQEADLSAQMKSMLDEQQQKAVIENYGSLAADRKENRDIQRQKITQDAKEAADKDYVARLKTALSPYNTSKSMLRGSPEANAYFDKIEQEFNLKLPDREGKFTYDVDYDAEDGRAYLYKMSSDGRVKVQPVMDPNDPTKQLRVTQPAKLQQETSIQNTNTRTQGDITVQQLRNQNEITVQQMRGDQRAKEAVISGMNNYIDTQIKNNPVYLRMRTPEEQEKYIERAKQYYLDSVVPK